MQYLELQNPTGRNLLSVYLIILCGRLTKFVNFRGFYRLVRLITRQVDGGELCTVKLTDDGVYRFHLADPYWSQLVFQAFDYEPEIAKTLLLYRELPYTFLDLGANYGFWSVMASSEKFGHKKAIAVEPVSANFDMLRRNCICNNDRFKILHAAMDRESGREVEIHFSHDNISNTAASLIPGWKTLDSASSERVLTISIDQLVAEERLLDTPLIIKLDVEGAELAALEGGVKTLEQDTLLIYEDHGMDVSCAVSEYILEKQLKVFYHSGRDLMKINDVSQLRRIKRRRSKGYNFIACFESSVFFDRLIRSAEQDRI